MIKLLTIAIVMMATTASAQQSERFYDSSGRRVGSSTTYGNYTSFYDASGRRTGSSTTSGNSTNFYDASGRRTGTTYRTR
jgi:YD repeat-containing protein